MRLFDAKSRALLRNLQGHAAACRVVSFGSGVGDAEDSGFGGGGGGGGGDAPGLGSGRLSLASAGDDATVRTWDAASGVQTARLDGHRDYVRALAPSPSVSGGGGGGGGGGIWASGGYDHLVKLWDVRADGALASPAPWPSAPSPSAPSPSAPSPSASSPSASSPSASASSPAACVATFDHGCPVESLVWLPGGALLASAGGRTVKLWDCLGRSRRPVAEVSCHQKTVSCLAAATFFVVGGGGGGGARRSGNAAAASPASRPLSGARLLTGSLDGHLRAFELDSFTVTYAASYGSPITAVGVSPSADGGGRQLAVGCSDGTLALRRRPLLAKRAGGGRGSSGAAFAGPAGTVRASRNPSHGASIRRSSSSGAFDASHSRYFIRGAHSRPRGPGEDTVVGGGGGGRRSRSSRRPGAVDRALRSFKHGEALDAAVACGRPAVVCALLDELAARSSGRGSGGGGGGGAPSSSSSPSSALSAALGGRTPERLVPLLHFIRRHVSDPRYALPLAAVGHALADVYAPALGADAEVDGAMLALAARARAGARDAAALAGVRGAAEALRALAVV